MAQSGVGSMARQESDPVAEVRLYPAGNGPIGKQIGKQLRSDTGLGFRAPSTDEGLRGARTKRPDRCI